MVQKRKIKLTPEDMMRLVYKELFDLKPQLVKDRLKYRKSEFYKAALKELEQYEARKLTEHVFWWVKD